VPSAWAFVRDAGGWEAIQQHNDARARQLADRVTDELGLCWLAPDHLLHHMVPLELPGVSPTPDAAHAFVRRVWERHRVQLWCMPLQGRMVLRLSGQLYVSADDEDRMVAALRSELT
jgi:selenocysteine lyase/cysteine desulfurase